MKNKFIQMFTPKIVSNISDEEYKALELDVFSRTIFGTSPTPNYFLMNAIACTIMNRVKYAKAKGGYWWGNDVISVCQKPYQYTCWNRSDGAYKRLMNIVPIDPKWHDAKTIAHFILEHREGIYDTTNGATHYHPMNIKPSWAEGQVPTLVMCDFAFYKLVNV